MSMYQISNPSRKVVVEFSPEILVDAIEIAKYRKPTTAKQLIDIYENLEGQSYKPEKNKLVVRKC